MLNFKLLPLLSYIQLLKAVKDFKLPDLNIPYVLEDGQEKIGQAVLETNCQSNPLSLPNSAPLIILKEDFLARNLSPIKKAEKSLSQENFVLSLPSSIDQYSIAASSKDHYEPLHSIPTAGVYDHKNQPTEEALNSESTQLQNSFPFSCTVFFFNPLELKSGQDGFLAGNGFPKKILPKLTELIEVVSTELIIALDSLLNSESQKYPTYLWIRELSRLISSNRDSLIIVKTQNKKYLKIGMSKNLNGVLEEPIVFNQLLIGDIIYDHVMFECPYYFIINFWKLIMAPNFSQGNTKEKIKIYSKEKALIKKAGFPPPIGRVKLMISADFMKKGIKKESEKIHQNKRYLEINNLLKEQELKIDREITNSTKKNAKCYKFSDLSNSPIAGFIYLMKIFYIYLADKNRSMKTEEVVEDECWNFIQKFKDNRSSKTFPLSLLENIENKEVSIENDNSRFMVSGAWMLLKLFFLGKHSLSSIIYPEKHMEYENHFTTLLSEAAYFDSLKKHIFS
ncbi:hypothetical protein PPACK8108_LOCUS11333 [Phakopsora pachyrhizi]|uniref:Uncharacterized protein n=1 Tax=Phakopsora pachyrhizi TaxID=170000 RepID=A0AAV0B0E6_PHAPC|nr:hypothetical protein PPACK8108_LOCUS11333 [Phakopsora pachyrhizi]